MNENMSESVGQIKDTMVETMNGVATSIGDVINDGMTKLPMKDTMDNANHLLEENLENLKNEMMNKAQTIGDETDKIADELIKDTEDVVRDAETGIVDMKNNAMETMENAKDDIMEKMGMSSPSHSIDTIQTSAIEPEIEKLTNGDDEASPEATVDELANLQSESMTEEALSAPTEEPSSEPQPEETPAPEEPPAPPAPKPEDELVVEDIKDE